MKRLSQLLWVILFLPVFTNAQSAYQPGFTVNLKGDTLHGFIKYRESGNNLESILFKTDTTTTSSIKFTPRDLKYFNVSADHLVEYVSYEGPVTTDNLNTDQLSIGKDSSVKQDTVFLKVVQQGKKLLLLSYSDNQKTRFFVAKSLNSYPSELIYRLYYNSDEENGYGRTVDDYTYKGQLYDLGVKAGTDKSILNNKLKKTAYKETDLIKVTSIINGISPADLSKNNPTTPKSFNKVFAISLVSVIVIGMIFQFAKNHN